MRPLYHAKAERLRATASDLEKLGVEKLAELKARYRGSVLGFFWSFVNPLLLLLIYSFVFTTVLPNQMQDVKPYALFMFCGILPWTWFAAG